MDAIPWRAFARTEARLHIPGNVVDDVVGQVERDDRLAGALIEAGLRVCEFGPRHHDAFLDEIRRLRRGGAIEHIVFRRRAALQRRFD